MIGFNRRFSPLAQRMKEVIDRSKIPFSMIYTCNAGEMPHEHWLHNSEIGGGRIIGEACHFIDLARYFASSPIKSINGVYMPESGDEKEKRYCNYFHFVRERVYSFN